MSEPLDISITNAAQRRNVPFVMSPVPGPLDVQPAPAPAPAAPPKVLTKAEQEMETRKREVLESMGWSPQTHDVVETPAAAPAVTPAAPAPAQAVPPVPAETPAAREARLIEAAATEAARRIQQQQPPPAPAAPAAPPAEALVLDKADARDLETLRWLSFQEPDKHAGSPAKFEAYCKALYTYRKDWLEKNAGQAFDVNADEHAPFFAANPSPFESEMLDEAREEMRIEQKVQQRIQPQLDRMQQERAAEAAQPIIRQKALEQGEALVKAVDVDLHKILVVNGVADFSPANLAKIEEADPVAARILNKAASKLTPVVVVLTQFSTPGLNLQLNAADRTHAVILDEITECEGILAASPAAVRNQNGRAFITNAELGQMRRDVHQSPRTEAEKKRELARIDSAYWAVGPDFVRKTIFEKIVGEARKEIKEFNELAEKQKTARGQRAAPAADVPPTPAPRPQPGMGRTRPPSIASGADLVPRPGGPGSGANLQPTASDVFFR